MVVTGPGPEKDVADGNPSSQPDPAHPFSPAAIQRSADHRYTFDGVTYPGVTSILQILDKSGPLMSWAARQTAEATLALTRDGTDVKPLLDLLMAVGNEGFIKAVTSRSSWKRDEAANLGTEVHALADLVVQGKPTPSMTETVRERVLLYAEWWKASGWRLRLSEALIINPSAGFGGTFDLLCYDRDGQTVLADVKTGNIDYRGRLYDSIVLQLAAYGMGDMVAPMGSPIAYPMPTIDRYSVIHVTADAPTREVTVPVGDKERQAFYACIALDEWKRGRK